MSSVTLHGCLTDCSNSMYGVHTQCGEDFLCIDASPACKVHIRKDGTFESFNVAGVMLPRKSSASSGSFV